MEMKKLDAYMKLNSIDDRKMAKKCGVSWSAVYAWRKGAATPRVTTAVRVEKATRGAVSVYDWK